MTSEQILSYAGIAGTVVGGVIWIWKKVIKPIKGYIDEYNQLKESVKKNSDFVKKNEYVDAKIDAMILLADIPMIVCNDRGEAILINQPFADFFHTSEKFLLGYGWFNFLLEESRDDAMSDWENAIDSGVEEVINHYKIKCATHGEEIVFIYHAIISRDSQRKTIVAIGKIKL